MPFSYLDEADREPDTQYRDILELIMSHGRETGSAHDEKSSTILAPPHMRFDLRNGVPLITERDMGKIWPSAVGELLAFINGVRTLEGLRAFGVNDAFWAPWLTEAKCQKRGLETGDMGFGYGAAFHDFETANGPFNQIKHVVEQIREFPELRSHRVVNWMPQYQGRGKDKLQRVVVTPCHGEMYFRVIEDELHLQMTQHKADMVLGVPNNMVQYAAFLLAMCHVLDLKPGEYVHTLVDAHVYYENDFVDDGGKKIKVSQFDAVTEMLSREARTFPTLNLRPDAPKDIFLIRATDFTLADYRPHDSIRRIKSAI